MRQPISQRFLRFDQRSSPLDFIGGFNNFISRTTSQVVEAAVPQAVNAAVEQVFTLLQPAPTYNGGGGNGTPRGGGTISSGAGFRGGTSPVSRSILSRAAAARTQSVNRSSSRRRRR
jgi:hypothetical protein